VHSFGIGGSELFGVELGRRLVERDVHVLCGALNGAPGPLRARCAEYGIEVVDLEVPWHNPLGRNGLSIGLVRRLQALRLDAVHLQHFLALNKLGLPARLAGIPRVLLTEHSVFDVDQSRAGRLRARLGWRLATSVTVIHQSIKDYLCRSIAIPPERIEVIPVGIELGRFHRRDRAECRARLGIGTEMVFIFSGRLAPVKNVPVIVAAFLAVMSRRTLPARLMVVGDGECRGACEELIRSHFRGAQVTLTGEEADVRPFLAAADVFVLHSSTEGTPRSLLEAMAMGVPGICPAVGGIPEILNDRGWLTRPNDQASLEAAMEFAVDHPAQVAALDEPCRAYVRAHFDAERISQRYHAILTG
jgi:glycosyltransferase involved in cell wall biosynthesis